MRRRLSVPALLGDRGGRPEDLQLGCPYPACRLTEQERKETPHSSQGLCVSHSCWSIFFRVKKGPLPSLEVSFKLVVTFPHSTGHQNPQFDSSNEKCTFQHILQLLLLKTLAPFITSNPDFFPLLSS